MYTTHMTKKRKRKYFKLESHKVTHDYSAGTQAAEAEGLPQVPGQPGMQHETLSQKYFKSNVVVMNL